MQNLARSDVFWLRSAPARLLFLLALIGVALAQAPATAAPAAVVRLIIDYGDGVETHYTALQWRDGMTVVDALEAAKTHARSLAFQKKGSGSSTLITRIGDRANEGGGAESKNWILYLNDKQADLGAGAQKLKAGDTVLWKFEVFHYNSP